MHNAYRNKKLHKILAMKLTYTLVLLLLGWNIYAAQAADDKEDKTAYHQLTPLPASAVEEAASDTLSKSSRFSICDYLCCCFCPTVKRTSSLPKGSIIRNIEKRKTQHRPLR